MVDPPAHRPHHLSLRIPAGNHMPRRQPFHKALHRRKITAGQDAHIHPALLRRHKRIRHALPIPRINRRPNRRPGLRLRQQIQQSALQHRILLRPIRPNLAEQRLNLPVQQRRCHRCRFPLHHPVKPALASIIHKS